MANIVSYVDIIEIMTDIASRHYQINTFFLGKNWELENNKDLVYPVLQVYPEFAKMPINDWKEYKTLELSLNCKVIDLTTPGEENEKDVHSDTLRIAQDIVNELNQHPFYIRSNVSLMEDISFTAIEEFKDDISAGWQFTLKLKIINANTFCGMPIAELPGYSANGPTSSGLVVNTQYLTCETLPACPTIVTIEDTLVNIQDQIDNLPPSALTLAQVLSYGNTTGANDIVMDNSLATRSIKSSIGNQILNFGDDDVLRLQNTDTTNNLAKSEYITTSIIHTVIGNVLLDSTTIEQLYNAINITSPNINLIGDASISTAIADTLTYFDGTKYLKSVTLGTGLSFVAGTLSATTPSLSGTAPIVYSAGNISITQATTSTNGYLSSIDWNTFNNKQPQLNGTGFVKASGTTITYDNSTYLTTTAAATTYVPYTGATTDVDLGAWALNAGSIKVNGTNGNGHIHLKHQALDAPSQASSTTIFADVNGDIKWKNDSLYYTTIKTSLNTADRVYTMPNASGTVALTSDLAPIQTQLNNVSISTNLFNYYNFS